ncbi:hypothetical protein DVZ84_37970 [Streptomyces parvulus]|uniref:WXG100 family type VII secretion target n=2 Tax=Streptomyces parvulus TaxID=146923 RepID=A0A369UWF3_9ACTN|nr:hypothetical protein DVZ84_37970 [Streptomyces parvulus]
MDEWLANLEALKEAIGVVEREALEIETGMASIEGKMNEIAASWSSPAYGTFDEIKSWFHTCQRDLEALMLDIIDRMNTTYSNYHNAEGTNYNNITDGQSGG